jgi:hypothetical protein
VQLLVLSGLTSYSQTLEEMRKEADLLFEQGKFVEATPLYSKLLSNAAKDPDLNFRYGTCLLYNSRTKSDAIKHLSFAVKDPTIDKRAFFYLGRAYHLNYQFNEAIVQYEKFKAVATPTQLKEFQVDQQIQACKNGKKLLSNVTDMIVIKKTEIKKEDFYEIYDLSNIGGTILVTDQFQSKLDKQRGHRSVIHFPANSPGIYYSSYGEDGSTGLDIYVRKRLPDGKFGEPQKVQGGVNTGMDEDYAYMHPDGRYLYFCSKGHNSMGGYDVFRCAYDERTNTFGQAENMDFAISSPDDDLLFVVDSLDQVAYFSSARESQDGKIFVYQVRVERIPLQIAVIKGNFVNSIFAANKVVSIEVQNFSTGETVGTFNSKEANGDYLITFPKPGKYIYLVTVKGSDVTHKAIVDIPFTSEFRPLKQRITVARDDNGEEYVKIENLFDEAFEDPIAVMAEIYREMSALIPNSAKFNIDSLNKANENNNVFVDAGLDPFLTKDEIEKVVDDEIKDLNNAIATDEKNAAIAYNLAETKSDSANAMMVEVNKMVEQAENTTDLTEKNRILNEVDDKTNQIERLNEESKDLVALGNELDKSIDEKQISLTQANEVKADLKATPAGDKVALGNTVTENKTFFVENVKDNSPHENIVDEIINSNAQQANSTQKLNADIATLRKEQTDLEKENTQLEQQLANTKNKKEQETIKQEILDNTNQIEALKIQIAEKEKAYDEAIKSGDNSQLGNAAIIVENPKNNTPENTKTLSDSEKNAITTKVDNNKLDANIAEVNKVLDENNIGGPALNLFATNETTKNYSLQQWNESIDSEIDRLNTQRMNATPEERVKIDQEIQRYVELKEQKKLEFERVTDPTKIEPTINKDDIVAGYTTQKDQINKITDEGERHNQNLNLNEQLRDDLLNEKANLQKMLDENPGSKNIEERIANVDKMLSEVNAEIVTDQNWIKQNTGTVVVNTEEIVAEVDPGYQSKVNEIYKISDPAERDKQMTVLNESFADKSNERVQELEAYVQSNPNDAVSKAELAELKRLNSQVATDATQPLVKPVVIDVATISPKVSPDQLLEDYTQRKTDIAKITDPYDRREAENNLNTQLSNEVRNEIRELEVLKEQNPGNTAITDRIENLKKLDDQLNSTIVSNETWMKANPQPDKTLVQESDVKTINPDYQAQVDQIEKIQDPQEKKDAITDLNTNTVEKIDDRIETLDKTLALNPNDQSALNEKAELTNLKTQIQSNPDESLTKATDVTSINTKPTIGEIMPDYQDKMNTINGSSESTIEKEKDKIALNENLVSLIDNEIAVLTNAKTENPAAAKDIDKRITGLNAIKTTTLAEIETSKTKIGDTSTTTAGTSQISANSVLPGYDKKMEDIQKNSKDEKTELTSENALNNQLIVAIDKKSDDLEKQKTANPSNAAAIDKDLASLENLKTEKQNEINANNDRIDEIDSGTTTSRPVLTINSIMPDYETKMASIEQSSSEEKTKLTEKNTLNNQLISAIDSEIADLQKEKADNPANAAAIDKDIQTLQNIKTQKQTEINLNNDRINEINSGTTSSRPAVTIASIMPEYDPKMAEITQKSIDEKAKLTEKNTLNNQLITVINTEITELEKEKIANPSNAAAIDKDIQTLKTIKTQKQIEIGNNNDRISEINSGTTSSRPVVTINSIMPDYETKMATIEQSNIAEKTKLTEKNSLNNQLISAIDSEIAELQKEKADNPANASAIDKDIQTLQNIKTQKQNEINLNNDRINEINSGTTSSRPAVTIASIMPDYETKMAGIDQKSADEKTKLTEKNALNNQLISAVDTEIADLQKEKATNPSNAAAIDKDIQTLQNIKTQKQNEINLNNDRINEINSGTTSSRPAVTIASIMPDYETKMASIDQKSADEKTKLTEKNTLNNQLITVVDKEIADLKKEKQKNPESAAAIDIDIQTLQNIKTQKQNEINLNNDRINEINSGTTSSRPVVTIASIMPDYDPKMAAIQQKNADEKTKLSERNALNNQLITAIDSEIAELQKEKESNPANAAAIDKDIQTLQNIKTQKQNEINLNNDRISEIENGSPNGRPVVTIASIMPDYEPKLAKIEQKTADEKTKLTEKNTLHGQLISQIDSEIADLEREKAGDPENATAIDKDIQTLQNIKTQKQNEINLNNDRIAEINSGTTSGRSPITISSLMPRYEPEMRNIDASSDSEIAKLEQKNALNRELISAIDSKIAALNNELKTNPANASVIQQEIDKLQELKESKTAEISKNNDLINSLGGSTASTKSVVETNPEDFSSEQGKNVLATHEADLEEIKAIDQDIEDLNNQLASTSDPKEQAKLEKQIDKKENSQARLENEVLEDLGDVNKNEFADQKTVAELNGDIATANDPNDKAILEANSNMSKADQLMAEAQQLRNEAAVEKDPIVANEKLELAFAKEQEAKKLIEEANRTFKTAEVIDNLNSTSETVVTSVPENVSDRESTELFDQANALDSKANELNQQATQLRDSSLTVKKKYREALVIEALKLDSIAAVYRDEANQIRTEANDIKSQEDAITEVLPETSNRSVDQTTTNDVIATNEYKDYYEAKTTGDSNLFRADELGNDIEELEIKKQRIIKDAIVEYGTGPELDQALANNQELKDTQAEIDRLTNLQEQYRDKALANYEDANAVLEKTDSQTRDNIVAISGNDLAPVEKITVTTNPSDADYKAPDQLNSSIFRTTDGTPVYNSEKPIPVDQQQPSGLVYKVQVGAFRKPLPPEYFNKFAPISGQKIGDGITRYMVGYFTNFTVADGSKEQIHDLGYGDAFVVAYCNGVRISITEAKEIEAGRKECPGTNLVAVNNMSINQTTTSTTGTNTTNTAGTNTSTAQNGNTTPLVTPSTTEEKQLTSYYTGVPDAAPANQVEIIKGLFFTVQIGVYSKPVKASLLYNISPLNSQLTETNKIRYTTGIYCNINDANKRKDEIVGIGITDAFVTAYYNGKRITIAEANELIAANGPSTLFDCAGNQIAN